MPRKKPNPNEGAILQTPNTIKQINGLIYEREQMLQRLRWITFSRRDGGAMGLTFNGTHQDDDLLELIRHPLRAHFLHKLSVNENLLKALGVIVETEIEENYPTPGEWRQAGGDQKDED